MSFKYREDDFHTNIRRRKDGMLGKITIKGGSNALPANDDFHANIRRRKDGMLGKITVKGGSNTLDENDVFHTNIRSRKDGMLGKITVRGGSNTLLANDDGKWYENKCPARPKEYPEPPEGLVNSLRTEAEHLMENEILVYNNRRSKDTNQKWMKTLGSGGTVTDKAAVFSVLVQNSPVHNLGTLRKMISLVKAGKKNECVKLMDVLTELFITDLLPAHRKLKKFEHNPLTLLDSLSAGNPTMRKKLLLYWYFEDQLKTCYADFLKALHDTAHDTVETNRGKSVNAMCKLLKNVPEQEAVLLSNIVNKLGDPNQHVSAQTMHLLDKLLQNHPDMKEIVLAEIESLLFRPHVGSQAQYYALCFLCQFRFAGKDVQLARNLIKVYFSFFKACIKKGEVESKFMGAILTGVKRAFPYSQLQVEKVADHIEALYQIANISTFNISIQALSLLFQVTQGDSTATDRYYRALYKKLMDVQLGVTFHQAIFLNLIYKSLKNDTEINRVKAFIKRLLQVSNYQQVPMICGMLVIISQLLTERKDLLTVTKEADFSDEEGEEHYEDVEVHENEDDLESVKHGSEMNGENLNKESNITSSWHHCKILGTDHKNKSKYDPYYRNPLFCGADRAVYLELIQLSQHYHPTVALFAKKILQKIPVNYSGDPLKDFTLIRFLDRFSFKNPKQQSKVTSEFATRKNYVASGARSLRVNSSAYLNVKEEKIPEDEKYLYTYLKAEQKVKAEEKEESDNESVASEEFDEMLNSLPEYKGSDEDIDEDNDEYSDQDVAEDSDQDIAKDSDEDVNELSSSESEGESWMKKSKEKLNKMKQMKTKNSLKSSLSSMFASAEEYASLIEADYAQLSNIDLSGKGKVKDKRDKTNKKQKKTDDYLFSGDSNVFASAEEFSEMLQDNDHPGLKIAGSEQLSNRDQSGKKQLEWEMKRNKSFEGRNNNNNMNRKRKFSKGKKTVIHSKRRK